MYLDESKHSESKFYHPNKNIPSTTKWVFKPNTDENTSVSVYKVVDSGIAIQNYIESQRPEKHEEKTLYDINVVTRYFRSINETQELETIPAQELNVLLARFFMHTRKKDGGVYEPSTQLSNKVYSNT